MTSTVPRPNRCRCCPYGFHIATDFVSYAQDVNEGHSQNRTPTLSRRNAERSLMSPLDSLFSDSMENLMSDFEEVLGEKAKLQKKNNEALTFPRNKFQNGYTSDYTGYRTQNNSSVNGNPSPIVRPSALDFGGPPKPPTRAPSSNGRSTPLLQKTPTSAYTALGRAVSEMKAKHQSESPFLERDGGSRVASRVGTPVDLSFIAPNGGSHGNHLSNGHASRNGFRQEFDSIVKLPDQTERTVLSPGGPAWRRNPVDKSPSSSEIKTNGNGGANDFASLRRGREYAMSDTETAHRVRYYSASPKLPRKLQAAPPLTPSQFTYTHQNGNTILAKTQGTAMSPQGSEFIFPMRDLVSVATSTGPLTPSKPCLECPALKKELLDVLSRLPPPKPQTFSISSATDETQMIEKGVGEQQVSVTVMSIALGTDRMESESVERGISPLQKEVVHIDIQTEPLITAEVELMVKPSMLSIGMQTDEEVKIEKEEVPRAIQQDQSTSTDVDLSNEKIKEFTDSETMTTRKYYRNFPSQTELLEPEPKPLQQASSDTSSTGELPSSSDTASQTEYDNEVEPRILEDSEIAESLWLMPSRNTSEIAVGPDIQEPMISPTATSGECVQCLQREQTFTRNVGVGACSVVDKVCVNCDNNVAEVDENDAPGFKTDDKKEFDIARAAAVKKLLTSEQKQNFVRGTAVSRSCRIERNKGDDLEYIEHEYQAKTPAMASPATTPAGETADALKNKVVLKKEIPLPPSKLPDPVPARIPRPKISRYAPPSENAETPDEADEAADRLTPLRSDLKRLGRWPRSSPQVPYSNNPRHDSDDEEDEESDGSEGSYDTNEVVGQEGSPFEISAPLREALESLNSHLLQPGTISNETADWALKYVQHEWLKTAAKKGSRSEHVDVIVEQLKELGPALLKTVVNITDQNGNTALHYAVSHASFGVVSSLLDSGECQLNLSNKAGYTAVMLAALSTLEDDIERAVVQRLFEMGDVNARATQHGQTALMLSVSHGKKETTELLLQCDADVNLQDEEGSTALMCAAEHGHKELVKLLLAQPGIDAALTDCDSSTALSIAVENGHRDIGVLIYAHLNYNRAESMEEA